MKNKDRIVLQKLSNYISDVKSFVNGYSYTQFLDDKKTLASCAFTVLQMGELAKRLSTEVQEEHTDMPWKGLRGMRNRIVHDYENIDFNVLWETIGHDLPEFQKNINHILQEEKKDVESLNDDESEDVEKGPEP
ncbi:HepT-like ribonuclease domain-containing protein [Sporolactobacillus sp. KGMB 08714]|uniref:HepT-like ribonuclease domain-containing protein n=1 Tax=Sporolactobacillus sp. KGMB 08714 TaxID=3064704 RepID=UPI002FBDC68F